MVRQFADRHAFLRELVQNGIDAGATRIDVSIERDERGITRTSVVDDGGGMSRAVIEGPLLTLFSSSKEADRTKIGKYGIGFVSVFAIEPDHVEVRTCSGAEAWVVRLFGDHSWELLAGRPGAAGTSVTLVQPMDEDTFAAHTAASERALRRWCRHARVPIALAVRDGGRESVCAIQEPFGAPGLAVATWEAGDERVLVAAAGRPPFTAAYFNRGLTLHETEAAGALAGVHVRIDSPALSHTLSRDDVLRDASCLRLEEKAADLVRGPLVEAIVARTAAAAAEASSDEYLALVDALVELVPAKRRRDLVVPLTDAIGSARTMRARELAAAASPVLVAADASPITRALARRGWPVVRGVEVAPRLRLVVGEVRDVAYAIARALPVPDPHPEDAALEEALLAVVRATGRKAARVWLARFEGALVGQPWRVAAATDGEESVVEAAVAEERRWGKDARVYLNVDDAAVRLARRRAKAEPALAAHLVWRALLLAEGALAPGVVDRLLEAALE